MATCGRPWVRPDCGNNGAPPAFQFRAFSFREPSWGVLDPRRPTNNTYANDPLVVTTKTQVSRVHQPIFNKIYLLETTQGARGSGKPWFLTGIWEEVRLPPGSGPQGRRAARSSRHWGTMHCLPPLKFFALAPTVFDPFLCSVPVNPLTPLPGGEEDNRPGCSGLPPFSANSRPKQTS